MHSSFAASFFPFLILLWELTHNACMCVLSWTHERITARLTKWVDQKQPQDKKGIESFNCERTGARNGCIKKLILLEFPGFSGLKPKNCLSVTASGLFQVDIFKVQSETSSCTNLSSQQLTVLKALFF